MLMPDKNLEPAGASGFAFKGSLFSVLTDEDREAFRRLASLRRFSKGESLDLSAEADGDAFVLVDSGRFLFTRNSDDGRRIVTIGVYPGEALLKLPTTVQATSTSQGEAQEPSTAFVLSAEALRSYMSTRPQFAWALVELMARQQNILELKLELQAFHGLPARVAALLLRLAARTPEIHLPHSRLAEGVGASREAVTRTLDSFRSQGLVVLSRTSITLVDPARLRAIADETTTVISPNDC
jgi:CRP-like cAMP-binding protein